MSINVGVFINNKRPTSKKAVKEAVANGEDVVLEPTSMFDHPGNFTVQQLRQGETAYFVGPDPYTSRKFYGTIEVRNGKVVVK